jgi:hypothetical protein
MYRSPWRVGLNIVKWRLIFVGHHSCAHNFEVAPRVLENLLTRALNYICSRSSKWCAPYGSVCFIYITYFVLVDAKCQ